MAEVTAQSVKELRDLTNLPMMECKEALKEAGGDQQKAIQILRQKVGKLMLKRAENPTSEGLVRIAINEDCSLGAMIELQCESAPVSKAEDFLLLADQCAKQLLFGSGATTADELLSQTAPDRAGVKLKDLYEETVNKIREKIVLARVLRVKGPVGGYVHHDGKTGVLFQATGKAGCSPVLRDVAMHIAALKPRVTFAEQLDQAGVQAERERLGEEARKTGKPENVIAKIVEGRLRTYYVEQGVLVEQAFAKDEAKTVSQALAEQGLKAVGFTRWILGTGN